MKWLRRKVLHFFDAVLDFLFGFLVRLVMRCGDCGARFCPVNAAGDEELDHRARCDK